MNQRGYFVKRIIIAVLIALGVVALASKARTAFADGGETIPLSRCFSQEPAFARLRLDGYQRVSAGIVGKGTVLIEVWANSHDGRFMIINVSASEDKLCIAVAGVNWQNYMVSQ